MNRNHLCLPSRQQRVVITRDVEGSLNPQVAEDQEQPEIEAANEIGPDRDGWRGQIAAPCAAEKSDTGAGDATEDNRNRDNEEHEQENQHHIAIMRPLFSDVGELVQRQHEEQRDDEQRTDGLQPRHRE